MVYEHIKNVAPTIRKNILLIKSLKKQYHSGIISSEFLDTIIDRLYDNSIFMLDPEMKDDSFDKFQKIIDMTTDWHDTTETDLLLDFIGIF
jgi:hypothetical protein